MAPLEFLFARPSEGWKLPTSVFFFTWGMATGLPLILVRGEQPLETWILVSLLANWAIASTYIFALLTNFVRLADRVRKLEEANPLAQSSDSN
jgi:hypothetical protein